MSKNLPKRKLNRLKNFDYSQNGFYFVTICVKYGIKFFGEINNNEMKLNNFGKIVKQQWLWLQKQYPYIKLDEFVIMPNHFHGIIIIDKKNNSHNGNNTNNHRFNNNNGNNKYYICDGSRDNQCFGDNNGNDEHYICDGRDNPRVVPTMTKTKLYRRQNNLLSKTICAFKTTSSKIIL